MVDNTLAMMVRPPEINPGAMMALASQLRAGETQNALAQLQLMQGGMNLSALANYRNRLEGGDPRAAEALRANPEMYAKVLATQEAERDVKREAIGRAGLELAPFADAPDFADRWRATADKLYKAGHLDEATYQKWKDNPNKLMLNQMVQTGLSVKEAIALRQQEADRAVGAQFSAGLKDVFGVGAGTPAPGSATPSAALPTYFSVTKLAESSGNPAATPPIDPTTGKLASTAAGLYQFTEGTWNSLASKYPGLGLTSEGRTGTKPDAVAQQEKAMRALTADNAAQLGNEKIALTDRNLYMAHVLGGPGAVKFLNGMAANPNTPATQLVTSEQAGANKSVFFDPSGAPRTAQTVYNLLTNRYGQGSTAVGELLGKPTGTIGGATSNPIAGIEASKLLPFLAAAASQPGLPKESRDVALKILEATLAETKPTDQHKNYNDYYRDEVAAGRVPLSRLDYEVKIREAGGTKVSVGEKGEDEFTKTTARNVAERINKIVEEGDKARQDLVSIAQLRDLGGKITTGGSAAFQAWLAEKGVKLGPNIGQVEAYSSLIDNLTPQQRVPGTGATSDFDAKMFKASLPRLINTPEGNRVIVDVMETLARYRIQRATIAEKAQIGEITRVDAIKQLRDIEPQIKELNDKIREANAAAALGQGGTIPVFNTPDDLRAAVRDKKLKLGDPYRTGDGRFGTVDDVLMGGR